MARGWLRAATTIVVTGALTSWWAVAAPEAVAREPFGPTVRLTNDTRAGLPPGTLRLV